MAGISIETTLELCASSLRDVKARIRPLFRQGRVAASASLFLDGLLGSRGALAWKVSCAECCARLHDELCGDPKT